MLAVQSIMKSWFTAAHSSCEQHIPLSLCTLGHEPAGVCRVVPRAAANPQLAATTPFDNFSFEPIREHQARRLEACTRMPFCETGSIIYQYSMGSTDNLTRCTDGNETAPCMHATM